MSSSSGLQRCSSELFGSVKFVGDKKDPVYRSPIRPASLTIELSFFHALVTMFFLFAEKVDLAPQIRFTAMVPYVFLVILIINVDTIRARKTQYPSFMLYAHSLILFPLTVIISREAHQFVALIYTAGIFLVYSQSGDPELPRLILSVTGFQILLYVLSTAFMHRFYIDTSLDHSHPYFGAVLEPQIEYNQVFPTSIGIFFIGFLFNRLANFVRVYSSTIEKRTRNLVQLHHRNAKLVHKIKVLEQQVHQEPTPQIGTPLELLLADIKELQVDSRVPLFLREKADHMLYNLSQVARGSLFKPLIRSSSQSNISAETSAWISDTLDSSSQNVKRKHLKDTAQRRRSILSVTSFASDLEEDHHPERPRTPKSRLGQIVKGMVGSSGPLVLNHPVERGNEPPDTAVLSNRKLSFFHNLNSVTRPSSAETFADLSKVSKNSMSSGSRRSLTLPPPIPAKIKSLPTTFSDAWLFFGCSEIASQLYNWEFNIFSLPEITKGYHLTSVALCVINEFELVNKFSVSEAELIAFLVKVERGYPPNPYHNSLHAADVLHAVFYFLKVAELEKYFDPVEILALVLATVVHDHGHPGINNNFIRETEHELTLIYNDSSPLENHHVSSVFMILASNPETNFLNSMEKMIE
ncbi:hypothetical protein GEMRC1_007395 [Eukaryota sp. GEM-RC1]